MPFDHFDVIASIYNRTARFSASEDLLNLLALPKEGLLLDAGGGTGRVAEALRNMVRQGIVADPSMGMLRQAREKSITTVCTPAENLPFASDSFDAIIMVDALHHVNNQAETIKEFWRVLAPGGKIVIIEPDIRKFTIKLIAIGEKILLMRSHFLSAKKIAAILSHLDTDVRVISTATEVWIYSEKVRKV
jgi:ubiquinone/menaquinone biosynthesis C-methylase UbiE